jgi:hypothetical protein
VPPWNQSIPGPPWASEGSSVSLWKLSCRPLPSKVMLFAFAAGHVIVQSPSPPPSVQLFEKSAAGQFLTLMTSEAPCLDTAA